jgi:hypothetical protein
VNAPATVPPLPATAGVQATAAMIVTAQHVEARALTRTTTSFVGLRG